MIAPGAAPGLSSVSVTQDATAAGCVVGYDAECIVTIYCVRDCDDEPGPDPEP